MKAKEGLRDGERDWEGPGVPDGLRDEALVGIRDGTGHLDGCRDGIRDEVLVGLRDGFLEGLRDDGDRVRPLEGRRVGN